MMTLQQVYYFLALCDEQSFTRAARRCGISQPSLTRAIKQLEAELGGSLFQRSRTKSRLSPLGSAVWPHLAAVEGAVIGAKREAAAFLGTSELPLPFNANPVSPFKPKENPMRKVVFGTAIAAVVVLFVAVVNLRPQLPATASLPTQASQTMNLRALMSKIDIKALPRQTIDYVD
jgi:hypothetical protein